MEFDVNLYRVVLVPPRVLGSGQWKRTLAASTADLTEAGCNRSSSSHFNRLWNNENRTIVGIMTGCNIERGAYLNREQIL